MSDDNIKTPYLAEEISKAVWAAFREDKTTYIDDQHGHVAAIVHPDNIKPTLTYNEAGLLADLLRAVGRGDRLRHFPDGADGDTDHPVDGVLRAFTLEGGGFYPNDQDIRDAYVWTSGITEHWYKVSDLIRALDNIDGKHGLDKPIAVIDTK
jgi:hypothetical protein